MDEVAAALARARGEDGQAARRRRRPAARLGALGRAVLDAGDDGHRPQPRAQRRVGRRASRKQTDNERFAYDSYRRFVQMFGKIVLDVAGDEFEDALERAARGARRRDRPRALGRRPQGPGRHVQGDRAGRGGHRVPRTTRTSSSATRSKPCSSRGTASARVDYRRDGEDPRRPRHRGQRADDGVRQQGRRLRHRRRVHPQPGDRRERAVRRLPHERAGRRRRRRHPHHRAARRDGQRVPRVSPAAARA